MVEIDHAHRADIVGAPQSVALLLPPTYVFEGLRAILLDGVFRGDLMLKAAGLNVVLFAAGLVAFFRLFAGARRAGTLLQLGE